MGPPRIVRALAELLIRGPDAPFLLGELADTFDRDLQVGRSPAEARRRYRANVIASVLSYWRWTMKIPRFSLGTSWLDLKLGLRMLGKQPGLTLVAVFALSIGIPASMIPIHLVDSLTVELPFPEGDRIVGMRNRHIVRRNAEPRALHDYYAWKDELRSFETIGAARSDPINVISDDGRAAPIRGSEITASAFDLLQVPPLMGRALIESDQIKGAPDVVVISHEVWQSRLGGDPDVIGETLRIGTAPHEIVGVMPEGFLFPIRNLLWIPLRDLPTDFERGRGPDILIFGRLADGVSLDEARAELETVGQRMSAEYPDTHEHLRPQVGAYTSVMMGIDPEDMAEMFLVQMVVLVLLAIVCGNVGTLILARTAARSDEIAVRTALGASRARIVTQLFVEALVLAVLATGVGLLIGDRIGNAFANRVFLEAPFWIDLGVKPSTVAIGLGLAVFCASVAGVVPAFKATGKHVQNQLQRAATGSGVRFGFGSSALIVAEVALALAFLTVGGSLATTLIYGSTVDDGIPRDEYMMSVVRIPWTDHTAFENDLRVTAFAEEVAATHVELARRLEAEPSISRFAFGNRLPGMEHPRRRIEVDGADPQDGTEGHRVRQARVDVGFFDGFGAEILDGRTFTSSDLLGTIQEDRTAVIVNTAFVERVLGGRNAVGARFRYTVPDDQEPGPWYEIIGVVDHMGMNDLDPHRDEGVYHPAAPGEIHPIVVAALAGEDPLSFAPRLREIVTEVNPDAMVQYPRVLENAPNSDRDVNRYGVLLLLLVSAIAIVLSGAGLYALMSFTVDQRRREIGIRTALGATAQRIIRAVATRALLQLLVGLALGAVAGEGLMRLLLGDQEVLHMDPRLLLAAFAGFILLVGALACVAPTLRGLRIQPVEALRE